MNITSLTEGKTHHARLRAIKQSNPAVVLGQKQLTVEQLVGVARYQTPVGISVDTLRAKSDGDSEDTVKLHETITTLVPTGKTLRTL